MALASVEVQGGDPLVVEVILPAEEVVQVVEVVAGAAGSPGPAGPAGPSGADSTVPGPTGPAGATGPAGTTFIGDAPPGSPSEGQLWWESDTGNLMIWYNDGDSSQWVPAWAGSSPALVAMVNQLAARVAQLEARLA